MIQDSVDKKKRAIIYFFSGTGNTALVAALYKKYFSDYEVELFQVKMVDKKYVDFPSPDSFDLVGIAYPIHGFNAPKVMNDFTKLLPPQNGKNAFVFKTSGEGLGLNNYSSQKIIRRLEKKGYRFLCERHYVMPYNMIFRHTPEMVKSEWIYANALVRLNVQEIQSEKRETVHKSVLAAWFVPIVRIEWLYAKAQGPFMKVNMKKCIRCMKCVKNCPLTNIAFENGAFKFGTNCALCVCCSFGCPTKAISIGLLNGWRINGSYQIEKTASDTSISFPAFGENLRGLKRILYYKYYRRADKALEAGGIPLSLQ